MKTLQLIQKFKDEGILTGQQASALEDIDSNRRFSLHGELRAVLYAGVLCLATGVGLILKTYFQHLGSIVIISTLSILRRYGRYGTLLV